MTTNIAPGGPYNLNPTPMPPPTIYLTNAGESVPLLGSSSPQQTMLCNSANFSYTVVNVPGGLGITILAANNIHISSTSNQGEAIDPISGSIPVIQLNVNMSAPGMGGNSVVLNFPNGTSQLAFVPWDASQGYGLNVEARVLNGEGFTSNLLS